MILLQQGDYRAHYVNRFETYFTAVQYIAFMKKYILLIERISSSRRLIFHYFTSFWLEFDETQASVLILIFTSVFL